MINTTDTDSWKETNHGRIMSEAIIDMQKTNYFKSKKILELGGGSANHTKLILENEPELLVTTELNQERLEVTEKAVEEQFGNDHNCKFVVADWLSVEGTYDILITNPPYFVSGKYNRRYFIDELILNGHNKLVPEGELIFVQSSMADLLLTEYRLEENGFRFEVIKQQEYPWRDYYFVDPAFLEMCDKNSGCYFVKDGDRWEILYVVKGTLKLFETDIVF